MKKKKNAILNVLLFGHIYLSVYTDLPTFLKSRIIFHSLKVLYGFNHSLSRGVSVVSIFLLSDKYS